MGRQWGGGKEIVGNRRREKETEGGIKRKRRKDICISH